MVDFNCKLLFSNNFIGSNINCRWLSNLKIEMQLGINNLDIGITTFNLIGNKWIRLYKQLSK